MTLIKKLKSKIHPDSREDVKNEKTVYSPEQEGNLKPELEEALISLDHEKLIKENMLSRQDYLDLIKTREDHEHFEKRIR